MGDVGGTKTSLALVTDDKGPLRLWAVQHYANADYGGLGGVVEAYLKDQRKKVDRACFAVAGPVLDARVALTNLGWTVDAEALRAGFGWDDVALINDLEGLGHAIAVLDDGDLAILKPGTPRPQGVVAVLALGTGLGAAYLAWDGSRMRPHASEAGHAAFAPANARQRALLKYLHAQHPHVSVERVCSGQQGVPNLYRFLKYLGGSESQSLRQRLDVAVDPTPVIVEAGFETSDALCRETLALLVEILGGVAGDLALAYLARGGVYLGGGLVPKLLPLLKGDGFAAAFTAKGRFEALLQEVPVYAVLNPEASLLGTAHYALARWGAAQLRVSFK